MKTIKIAHLYYDLMNLYGESGNVLALTHALEKQSVKVDVVNLSIHSKIDFSKIDIFYMGCGDSENLELARNDILRYKEEIKKNIGKKVFIATGNSYLLFGNTIDNKEALGVFNFDSKTIRDKIVGEQLYKTYILEEPVIGFQNRVTVHNNDNNHFFKVIKGNADNNTSKHEGILKDNFYGTYLIGPLLIRNPHLLDYIVENILKKYNKPYKKNINTLNYKAYNEYMNNFYYNL